MVNDLLSLKSNILKWIVNSNLYKLGDNKFVLDSYKSLERENDNINFGKLQK